MTLDPLKETTYLPDQTFPINVFEVGAIATHWHDHMEWIAVTEGCARIQVDAEKYTVGAGGFVFVRPKQLHAATDLEPGTKLTALVVGSPLLRGIAADGTLERYVDPLLSGRLRVPNVMASDDPLRPSVAGSIASVVDELRGKRPGYELLVKSELFRMLGLLLRAAGQPAMSSSPSSQPESAFTRLLEELRSQIDQPVTVSEAAERVGVAPTYFCRRFKQLTGRTLVEYMQVLRINEAERLLAETDLSVTAVAERVGFGSITYFGRVFKAFKQHAPSDVRRLRRARQTAGQSLDG